MATILIVDDERCIALVAAMLLEARGDRVLVAHDGADGLRQALRTPPDLVLTDLMMPIMDGVALCRALRVEPRLRDVPIVLMSAAWTALRDAPCDFSARLPKPFDVETLLAVVDAAFGRAHEPARR